VIVVAAGLLSLINIGSSVVLSIILSLVLEAFFASYLISLSLLLYRRLRGDISDPSPNDSPSIANETAQGRRFIWGPFRLKGWVGTANNIVAIIFSVIMMFFSCWPPKVDPAPDQVNYSIVMFSGITILSIVYYFGWARKHYQGPIIEVTVIG
jgi:choline transport protein